MMVDQNSLPTCSAELNRRSDPLLDANCPNLSQSDALLFAVNLVLRPARSDQMVRKDALLCGFSAELSQNRR